MKRSGIRGNPGHSLLPNASPRIPLHSIRATKVRLGFAGLGRWGQGGWPSPVGGHRPPFNDTISNYRNGGPLSALGDAIAGQAPATPTGERAGSDPPGSGYSHSMVAGGLPEMS